MSDPVHRQKAWLKRTTIHGLPRALADVPQRGTSLLLIKLDRLAPLQRSAVIWITGATALAILALLLVQLGLNFAAAAFVFLIAIVLLSLLDTFISSAIFSLVGAGFLGLFFTQPLHIFIVDDPQKIIALVAFLATTLAVTGLVRQVLTRLSPSPHDKGVV